MQMLAAGGLPLLVDDARPPDEHNPRGYFEYAPVKASERDVGWIEAAEGRGVKVIHRLLVRLPPGHRYRVILLRRDLGEVLASQRAMLARTGDPPADAVDEARLGEVMAAQLDEAEAWARSTPGVELLVVEHADLVRDPIATARAIAGFVDRDLETTAMAACVDPALHRQRARPGAGRATDR